MSWPTVSLEEISESIVYGLNASATNDEHGPRFLRITDIHESSIDWNTVPSCECSEKELEKFSLSSGDIVFARTGATTGKSCLIHDCPTDSVFASYLIRVRLNEKADPKYISHFFQSPMYWAQIRSTAVGAAQPGINATKLKKMQIPLPPIDEQKRIGIILDKADEIEKTTLKSNEIRVELKNSIFFDLFGDLSINPHDFPEYDLSEIADFQEGPGILAVDFHDEGIPLLRLKGIENEFATLDGCNYLLPEKVELKWKHFCVQKGDILIGSSASVGRVSIVDDNTIGAIPYTGIIRFRINEKLVNRAFILALLRSEVFIRQVTRMSTGSTIKHFGPTHLKKVRLPVPPLNLQNELDKLFSSLNGIETTDVLAKVNSQSLSQNLLS